MNALVKTSALALTAALIGYAPLGNAAPIEGTITSASKSITVSYRELDITKPWGLEVLYSRIQHAARSVCDFDFSVKELGRMSTAKKCYLTAVDDAVRQINRPTLTAYHRAKVKSVLG